MITIHSFCSIANLNQDPVRKLEKLARPIFLARHAPVGEPPIDDAHVRVEV